MRDVRRASTRSRRAGCHLAAELDAVRHRVVDEREERRGTRRDRCSGRCSVVIDIGRPLTSAIARMSANSPSRSTRSEMISNTPCPVAPIALRDAEQLVGGRGEARRGSCRPTSDAPSVRDVEKPSAPASIASAASRPIVSISASRGHLGVIGAAVTHHERAQRRVRQPARRSRSRGACCRSRRGTRGSSPIPT